MIFTSYFPFAKKVKNPIAISRSVPTWYDGKVLNELAPSWNLLLAYKNKKITEREYTELYIKELVDNGITIDKLKELIPDESTLLCWETPDDFCHRHIIANILRNAGVKVYELDKDYGKFIDTTVKSKKRKYTKKDKKG